MREYSFFLALVVTAACSTPTERRVDPDPYQPTGDPEQPPPRVKPRVERVGNQYVGLYSYGDIAEQLRMPVGFAVLAGLACSWQSRCNPDAVYPEGQTTFDCKIQLARLWCPPDSCSDGEPEQQEWEECFTAMYTRECEPLEAPSGFVDCPLLHELKLGLNPKGWLITDRVPYPTH